MERRHLDTNPLDGGVKTFWFDDAEDKFHLNYEVDLQPHIDLTQEAYKEAPSDWKGDSVLGHHVAAIPLVLLPELEKKGIMTAGGRIMDSAKLKEWLNDRDNRAFRTRPGRV
jgi:hypothetical protein